MRIRSKGVALALIVAMAGAMSGPAAGGERRASVVYGDLDLNRETDVAVLFQRLRTASAAVCAPQPTYGADAGERDAFKACRQAALADAIAKIAPAVPVSYSPGK